MGIKQVNNKFEKRSRSRARMDLSVLEFRLSGGLRYLD